MSTMPTLERQQQTVQRWKDSPITRHHDFSAKKLWAKQEEILWAVRKYKKVAVRSGNTVGKTFIAADIIFDFLSTNYPAKVITTAPCYDDQTEILTDNGWKLFSDLTFSDKVAQLNKGCLEFTELKGIVKFKFIGELIGYKNQLIDFLVTPEHRCLVNNDKIELAKNIYGKSFKFRKYSEWIGEKEDNLDYFEFLGFWFAEGCAEFNEKKRKYRVVLTQKNNVDYVIDLLKRNKFSYKQDKRKNGGYNFTIYNKEFARKFSEYGKALTKKIPIFVKNKEIKALEAFLYGYIKGDGCLDKNGSLKLFTSSKKLADDLQEIALKCGWVINLNTVKASKKNSFSDNYRYILSVWKSRGKFPEAKKKTYNRTNKYDGWYKKKYDGYVHCVSVPSGIILVRRNGKYIWSGNTWDQVESVLWKEIARYYHQSKVPINGTLLGTELKFNDEWFAKGISTNEVYRFQGYHSPSLLVIIDEASGVMPEIWEAVEALHPSKILAIGNPNESTGNFFDCFSSSLWHKIAISCEECVEWQVKNGKIPGLVTQEWINERAEEWGKSSPLYDIHVRGEFPQEPEGVLIPRKFVEDARQTVNDGADGTEVDLEEDSERILSCDVATKHGDCATVIGYRYGHTLKDVKGFFKISTTSIIDRLSVEYAVKKTPSVVIDSDGIGEGVSDGLSAKRIPVLEFHGGYASKAMDSTKFRNLRSQFYWILAKKFEKGMYSLNQLDQKSYEVLKNQLCVIKVKPPDGMGRIQIETKEDMLARGIKSPDYADMMMMSEYGHYMAKFAEMAPIMWR